MTALEKTTQTEQAPAPFATVTMTTPAKTLEWSPTLLDGRRVDYKTAVEAVEALGEGWRMPTRAELVSLVDDTSLGPAINTDLFPDTKSTWYWTGTPCKWDEDSGEESARWVVLFGHGGVDGNDIGDEACVRAVRGGQ
ncbi:DUF1566 domain-containing protein [Rheinheimera soli]|uniref:Lcl C-terminal domain-containing protein n=1 Tax=Rheinheimera soli TaxID=443616 RepID=A0ABU1VVK4_9GAMM|nr:DUF1566 domain-containing protein [Rheinheimera soli]MDR7119727.1 hypothetical protein [Rheinheimera soli]